MNSRVGSYCLVASLFFLLLSCSWDPDGIFSDGSDTNSGNVPVSGSVPGAPTELTVLLGERQVTIQWKTVAGATSYNLYWSQNRGVTPATGTKIADIKSPHVHTGLTEGATYSYIVTAVNAAGESSRSEEVTITINKAPSAPTGVSAAGGDGRVVLTWNPVEKATSYSIYWSNTPGLQAAGGNKIANVTSPYTHGGLSNGSSYYYVVTAVNDHGESIASVEVSAIPVNNSNNARLRVAWVQDVSDGGDPFGAGGNLRLMGLDTADGVGERVILSTVGSYVRPLITPKGDRVVYSNRISKKVYIVNWNGTGLREIVPGFALAVWMNLLDGREWVYFGEENWGPDRDHTTAVYRIPLDGSGSRELVWDRTPVLVVGFQLSADGRMASGNFPWPDGGVAQLPNQSWTRLGNGCWTSLAPDNSYRFWLMDDSHRNLYMTDRSGENGRTININNAPGIDGWEVYHPRWSNHPRIMAMTGPYKVGSGTNRIDGGGPEVEIYIGRFNENFTAIESWQRVTNNNLGDFFPDVWISP